MLKAMRMDEGNPVSISGNYREKTAEAVRNLQRKLNVEADGHFGPATRVALAASYGIDVNAIPASIMAGKTKEVRPDA